MRQTEGQTWRDWPRLASDSRRTWTVAYRVTLVVAYLGWVDYDCGSFLCLPGFCLGCWEFGRIGWSTGQGGGTLKIRVNPTKVHDHQSHPVHVIAPHSPTALQGFQLAGEAISEIVDGTTAHLSCKVSDIVH